MAAVPGMEMGLPGNSPLDFIITLWAGMPRTAEEKRPNHKWGKRERGKEERLKGSQQPWEQRSEDKIIDKGGVGGGRDEEHISHPACAATGPQTPRVEDSKEPRGSSGTLTFSLTHAETAVSRAANRLLPPDPERQLSWGHSTVQRVGVGSTLPPSPDPSPIPQETGSFSLPLPPSRCMSAPGQDLRAAQGMSDGTRLTLTPETDLGTRSGHKHPLISLEHTCFSKVLHGNLAAPAPF